jgi:hypothetical protein
MALRSAQVLPLTLSVSGMLRAIRTAWSKLNRHQQWKAEVYGAGGDPRLAMLPRAVTGGNSALQDRVQ